MRSTARRRAEDRLRRRARASPGTASPSRPSTPSREYYAGAAAIPSAPIRSFFEGEPTSEVGRDGGPDPRPLERDAARPELLRRRDRALRRPATPQLARGAFPTKPWRIPTSRSGWPRRQGEQIASSVERYMAETPPAEIRFNVNPFVVWFWIGVIVGVGGALFALWPARRGPAPPRLRRLRSAPRPRAAPRALGMTERAVEVLIAIVIVALVAAWVVVPLRRAAAAAGARRSRTRGWPSSRRASRPSTGRSATPSSTTPRGSSPTRSSPDRTPSCGARRSRSSSARCRRGRADAAAIE